MQSPVDPHGATPAELKERIDAERRGTPFLVHRTEDGRQVLVDLDRLNSPVTIGRNPDNDVALVWDPEVSRLHAELERIGSEWALVDDGLSRNGSFVNGERIVGRRRLREGDRLVFGETAVVYRNPAEGGLESTLAVPLRSGSVSLTPTQHKILVALCRPVEQSSFATPATNRAIADEVFLSVDAVKAHLRTLFERFGLEGLPQNQKRARLATTALVSGLVSPRDM